MGCKGYCDQGRKPCELPEECDDDLGAACGIFRALIWTALLMGVGAVTLSFLGGV